MEEVKRTIRKAKSNNETRPSGISAGIIKAEEIGVSMIYKLILNVMIGMRIF